ncbi:DNA polymerase III subunit alpha [Candidatus Shapirobacteria bacterium]|nr:MAG: DNA polymerase III subunit alpha [Candidatus Shapirobacteria bacterium]
MPNFVHLHLHTEYSLLDGLIKIKNLIPTVKNMGMNSVAITDHGVMYGVIEFYKACNKEGIKPIIGCEMYLATQGRKIKTNENRKNQHLILLAKNHQGYKNLMKLVSLAHIEGFYYKPRIDWELLQKYHQGLIATSACVQGEIPRLILNKQYNQAKKRALEFQQLFEDDYYLEIQHHINMTDQETVNQGLIKISQELGIPLVAANDSHYLKKEDAFAQDVLLMINTRQTINDKKRLTMMDSPDFFVKSPQQMAEEFAQHPEALANTQKIADKCNLEIELGKWYFPNFELQKGETTDSQLRKETFLSAEKYYGKPLSQEIIDRLNYELSIISPKGYSAYFLIMRDFINWAENHDTIVNTRGSAAGSLVSFVLGITSVDPLIYQLPFERFLNKDRPSPPDIDLDISDDKRQQMLYHIADQYGVNSVAQVCTFGRMMARGSVRDTARVLGYDYAVGDKIAKLIPQGSQGFPMSIDKALELNPDLKQLYDSDPDSKKILDTAKQIEGSARHVSVHACALVISPTTVNDFSPTQVESGGDKIITQYEMHAIEDVGLIKFDILGISNLAILGNAIVNVRKTKNIKIDLRKINVKDKKTFKMLTAGHTMGVFQLGGGGMTKWLKELKPSRVEDIMAMVALYRPGPMSIIPEYIARKRDPSQITYIDSRMESFLQKSYGLLVYQDDCLYTAINLAGYNWVEADKFRKAIGKKIPSEMDKQKQKFINGCVNNGLSQDKATHIFEMIEPFVGYGFNKAHACAYGMLAYRTAYMKANYPVEYMCALLTAEAEDLDKVSAGVEECRRMGVIVSPPDINKSLSGFEIESNPDSIEKMAIRFGLNAIKNVGQAALDNIIDERKQNGPFKSFNDFCLRVDNQKVNKKVLESLIKAGAMDQFGQRNAILQALDEVRQKCQRIKSKHDSGQFSLFDQTKDKESKPIAPPDNFPQVEPMPEKEKLALEKELIGVYISQNPIKKLLKKYQSYSSTKIQQLIDNPNFNQKIRLAVVINRSKIIRTKKSNAQMAFLTLEDETGKIEAVVFPKLFEEKQNLIVDDKVILIEGKLNDRDGQISIIIEGLNDKMEQVKSEFDFTIKIPTGTSQQQLMQLNQLLKQSPNGHKGLIIMPNGKNIKLAYGVNYSDQLQQQIDKILNIN